MSKPYLNTDQIARLNLALKEVSKESDRAAVILLCAEIDSALCTAIEASFLPASGREDRLLRPDGPLGTLAARIEVAFRLGIISNSLRRELDYIRRIRNEFAHKPAGFSFHDVPVVSYASELQIASWLIENRVDLPFKITSPRNRFTLSAATALSLLSGLTVQVSCPKEKITEWAI